MTIVVIHIPAAPLFPRHRAGQRAHVAMPSPASHQTQSITALQPALSAPDHRGNARRWTVHPITVFAISRQILPTAPQTRLREQTHPESAGDPSPNPVSKPYVQAPTRPARNGTPICNSSKIRAYIPDPGSGHRLRVVLPGTECHANPSIAGCFNKSNLQRV